LYLNNGKADTSVTGDGTWLIDMDNDGLDDYVSHILRTLSPVTETIESSEACIRSNRSLTSLCWLNPLTQRRNADSEDLVGFHG